MSTVEIPLLPSLPTPSPAAGFPSESMATASNPNGTSAALIALARLLGRQAAVELMRTNPTGPIKDDAS